MVHDFCACGSVRRSVADAACSHRTTSPFAGKLLGVVVADVNAVARMAVDGSVGWSLRRCDDVAARSTVRPARLRTVLRSGCTHQCPPLSAKVRTRRDHEIGSLWPAAHVPPVARWEPTGDASTTTTRPPGGERTGPGRGSVRSRVRRFWCACDSVRRSIAHAAYIHRATCAFAGVMLCVGLAETDLAHRSGR